MARSKQKKFEQSIATPYRTIAPGSTFLGGMRGLLNTLFGELRPYVPSPREVADYHLTPREREIAYLAALGFSDKEIADALAMNFQTVRVHIRNVLNKMNLNDPRELQEYFVSRDE